MKNNNHPLSQERWDLLDQNRVPVGKTLRRGEKIPAEIYHIVVLGWIVNRKGEFLISRRSPEKKQSAFMGNDRRSQAGRRGQPQSSHSGDKGRSGNQCF